MTTNPAARPAFARLAFACNAFARNAVARPASADAVESASTGAGSTPSAGATGSAPALRRQEWPGRKAPVTVALAVVRRAA